jgi:hypothetical protein
LKRGLHVLGRDGFGFADRGGEERVMVEAVGLAGQAGRRLVDSLDRGWLEERQLATGELDPMREIRAHLVTRETADVSTYDDALGQRIEASSAVPCSVSAQRSGSGVRHTHFLSPWFPSWRAPM